MMQQFLAVMLWLSIMAALAIAAAVYARRQIEHEIIAADRMTGWAGYVQPLPGFGPVTVTGSAKLAFGLSGVGTAIVLIILQPSIGHPDAAIKAIMLMILVALLSTAVVIDLRCQIIPDAVNWVIFVVGAIGCLLGWLAPPLSALLGFITMTGIGLVARLYGRRVAGQRTQNDTEGFGLGDVKLMAACSLWIGMEQALVGLGLGVMFSLLLAAIWRSRCLPAGPGLAGGFFLASLVSVSAHL